jgi:hypothetical protein
MGASYKKGSSLSRKIEQAISSLEGPFRSNLDDHTFGKSKKVTDWGDSMRNDGAIRKIKGSKINVNK